MKPGVSWLTGILIGSLFIAMLILMKTIGMSGMTLILTGSVYY